MKLEEFVKIDETVDLIHTNGGNDTNSTWMHNHLCEIASKMLASGATTSQIKKALNNLLRDYIIDDEKFDKQLKAVLSDLGFKFKDVDQPK